MLSGRNRFAVERISLAAIFAAMFLSSQLHLAALQLMGWSTMFANYAQDLSVFEAVEATFTGPVASYYIRPFLQVIH